MAPVGRSLGAQGPAPRPWLDWRTAETEHFVFHFPSEYRVWTLTLADRIEAIRKEVGAIVGYVPTRRVHVVVDDPVNVANGYAFPTLDAPTIVLWPVSPDPRSEIGDYAIWQELLAIHEFAHLAHLGRPSRNRWQRLIRKVAPVPLGPIPTKAPRWVTEGYATFVEGRVSGTGRPNNAWRAAILRQFALEGRLPTYGQLSGDGGWKGGSFAYLAGSAYLEWLGRREGDSSVVALWRRMTAKTDRSFESAFAGLYGGSPAELYGRFMVSLTADAVEVARQLDRQRLAEGALVQRLMRSTGDPAVSPDGRHVALTIRKADEPSALVVWRTTSEPDTAAAARRTAQQRRDPEDVPDRAFYPPRKRDVATLRANDGAPYETPRWFSDNRRILVSRHVPADDGTVRPDLFVFNAEDGSLERLTRGAALREADPSADGRWAAAVRCQQGWCDLVRIDLATKAIRVLQRGSVTRNFYRPRVSDRTGEIVVAEQKGDRWRIARVSSESGELRYADPDDGISRYDATFDVDGTTIIATVERGGFANVERLGPDSSASVPLTRVTGAAVAADVAADGSVWFLNLHAAGYDLRRLVRDSASTLGPLAPIALDDTLSSVLPPSRRSPGLVRPAPGPVTDHGERRYGLGPSRLRYIPSISGGFGGTTTTLALVRSDPVGRFGASLMGAVGSGTLPAGVALAATSRVRRGVLGVNGWASHEAPSRLLASDSALGLDLSRAGGAVRFDRRHVRDASDLVTTLALLGEHQAAGGLPDATRGAAVISLVGSLRQFDENTRYLVQLSATGEVGSTAGGMYARQRSELLFGFGRGFRSPITARVGYGNLGVGDGSEREQFVVGGVRSPLIDPLLDGRRVEAPAYPVGSASGSSYVSYRVGLPLDPAELFYSGITTESFQTQRRSYGAEVRERVPAIAALGTPELDVVTGIARALDAPVEGRWRYYVGFTLRP